MKNTTLAKTAIKSTVLTMTYAMTTLMMVAFAWYAVAII